MPIDDYMEAHTDAEHDEFILDIRQKADAFKKLIQNHIGFSDL